MSESDRAKELTQYINDKLGLPSDVFWAVREANGKLRKGFWYRIWKDESRQQWLEFQFLGETYIKAKIAIDNMAKRK